MLRTLTLTLAGCLALASSAAAIPVSFQRIVDTNTGVPGGSGTFTNLEWAALDGGRVAFTGFGASGQRGIYANSGGGLVTVVDQSTTLPGVTTGPNRALDAVVDGQQVVFYSFTSPGGEAGLYRTTLGSGSYEVIYDESTAVPDSPGGSTFGVAGGFDADDGVVVFDAQGAVGEEGLYRYEGGTLTTIANESTPMPGRSENFNSFASVNIDAGQIVFGGGGPSGHSGIYSDRTGSVEAVAEEGDTAPGGQGSFIFFGFEPNIDGGSVTFEAVQSLSNGIYLDDGNTVQRVVDGNTVIPEGSGNFQGYHDWTSSEDGLVLFRGTGSGSQDGIYLADTDTDEIIKLIADGDILDGLVVDHVNMTPDALADRQVVLTVSFQGAGGEAIYLLTIPEPGSFALLSLGLVGLAARRGRARAAARRCRSIQSRVRSPSLEVIT